MELTRRDFFWRISALSVLKSKTISAPLFTVADFYSKEALQKDAALKRFDLYRKIGFRALRLPLAWCSFERSPGEWNLDESYYKYLMLARSEGFLLKPVIGCWSYAPDWFLDSNPSARVVGPSGQFKRQYISPWFPEVVDLVLGKQEKLLLHLKALDLFSDLPAIIADLGPAGEPIYPAAWEIPGLASDVFWFYGKSASASFQSTMRKMFDNDLSRANTTWSSSFGSWEEITPTIRSTKAFWQSVLSWYRESKRSIEQHILNALHNDLIKSCPTTRIIALLPGSHSNPNNIYESEGPDDSKSDLKLMTDWDYIFTLTQHFGVDIQYTSAQNIENVSFIIDTLRKQSRFDNLWLENAGGKPLAGLGMIENIIKRVGIQGYDYIGSVDICDINGIPNPQTCASLHRAIERTIPF